MASFRRNDQVIVIAGDDRGKTGRLLKVFRDAERVIVERVNFIKRHTRARSAQQQGGVIEREAPLHVSNVMHFCAKCQMGVRMTVKATADGKRERYCKRCGELIPRVI
jgi:large subunit ribosomal protein L24